MSRYEAALDHADAVSGEVILEQSEKLDGTIVQTVERAGVDFIREIARDGTVRDV